MQDLYVTWDEYNRLIEQLALQIHVSGYQFDSLLCLARGGASSLLPRASQRPAAHRTGKCCSSMIWSIRVSR